MSRSKKILRISEYGVSRGVSGGGNTEVSSFFDAHPNNSVVFGNFEYIDADGAYLGSRSAREFRREELIRRWDRVYYTFMISQPACFVRREVVGTAGFLNEENHLCMDYEWYLNINTVYHFFHLPQLLAKERIHPERKSKKQWVRQYFDTLRVSSMYWHERPVYYRTLFYTHFPWWCIRKICCVPLKKAGIMRSPPWNKI